MYKRESICMYAILFLLSIAVILVYSPSFTAPFVLDDQTSIVENPFVHLRAVTWDGLAASGGMNPARTVPYATFALNFAAGGLDPYGYRMVNVAILVATGLLLVPFGSLFSRPWLDPRESWMVGAVSAVLWTLHPLQTNQTTYIVQRMTSLAVLFVVATVTFFLLAMRKNRVYFVPAAAFALLAAFSKEIAWVLPAALVLYLAASEEQLLASVRRHRFLAVVGLISVVVAAGIVAATYRPAFAQFQFSIAERLLTEPRVLLHYLSLYFFPFPGRFSLLYDFPVSTGPFSPLSTLPAVLFHAGLIVVAAVRFRKDRLPALLVLLYYLFHLMESTALPLDLVFEHRMCLPGIFLSILVAYGIVLGARRFTKDERRIAPTVATITALAGIMLGGATYARNLEWADPEKFWVNVTRNASGNGMGWCVLGEHYMEKGNYPAALEMFVKAVSLDPSLQPAWTNRGAILVESGDYRGGLDALERARFLGDRSATLSYNMGLARAYLGDVPGALTDFKEALAKNPAIPDARYNMAVLLARIGKEGEARALALEELRINPGHGQVRGFLERHPGGPSGR